MLACGVLSSLVYVGIDLAAWLKHPGYDFAAQTISELSAIGAPFRSLFVSFGTAYDVLIIAFGVGILLSAGQSRALRATGALLIAAAIYGSFWPPMHERGAVMSLTDTLHIAWTAGWLLLTMAAMGFAAAALGKRFLRYTIATLAVVILFGALTGSQGALIAQNLPTPWAGIAERITIGAFLIWIAVFAVQLWRRPIYRAALSP